MTKLTIDPSVFREFLVCDSSSITGLRWIKMPSKHCNKLIGEPAGKIGESYCQVTFKGKKYCTHKIVYALSNDIIIDGDVIVDHIDGDKLNNAASNLRLATDSQNNQNAVVRKDNSTGHKNVYYHKRDHCYVVSIQIKGVRYEWRNFSTPEQASVFASDKRKELQKEFSIEQSRGI